MTFQKRCLRAILSDASQLSTQAFQPARIGKDDTSAHYPALPTSPSLAAPRASRTTCAEHNVVSALPIRRYSLVDQVSMAVEARKVDVVSASPIVAELSRGSSCLRPVSTC